MNKEKTIEERIINYSNHDSLDRHMPPTSKKQFVAVCLLSPFIALTAWLWLIVIALQSD